MGHYVTQRVAPDFTALHKEDQLGGRYRAYIPSPLAGAATHHLDTDTSRLLVDAVVAVERAAERMRARPLDSLYATLVKSESISSSWIEGLREQPRDVLVAGIGVQSNARAAEIAANIESTKLALASLAENRAWSDDDIHAVHGTLLPHHPHGYRTGQVWIGGRSVFRASYVAPPGENVPALMTNLLEYANASPDAAIVTAGLLHAQFETIHPYADGNGRTGRALIHAVLARAGVVDRGLLPISSVLKGRTDDYIQALTAFRYEGEDPAIRRRGFSAYMETFLSATIDAASLALRMHDTLARIEGRWRQATSAIRSDSTVHQIIGVLMEQPAVTVPYLATRIDATPPALYNSVQELMKLGILSPPSGKYRRAEVFCADEVLATLLVTERSLASPTLDTVTSAPIREVPPLPAANKRRIPCPRVLPRKGTPCTLASGHRGRCR